MTSTTINNAATSTPVAERTAQKRAARKAPAKKAAPKTERTPGNERPATDRQVHRIGILLAERDSSGLPQEVVYGATHTDELTSAGASAVIDAMLDAPFQEGREPSPVGFYVQGKDVFKVKANKTGTSTYAMRLVVRAGFGAWEYAPEAGRAFGPKPVPVKRIHDAAIKAGLKPESAKKVFAV